MLRLVLPLVLLTFCASPDMPQQQTFEGIVELNPAATEKHTFHRVNRYLLTTAEGQWELYTGSRDETVAPFLGKRVRIAGTSEEATVEGVTHREIRISRIEEVK